MAHSNMTASDSSGSGSSSSSSSSRLKILSPITISPTLGEISPRPSPATSPTTSPTKRTRHRSNRFNRVIYYGIKRGWTPGVYVDVEVAEEQVLNHPDPCVRCFSTRYAAEAYVGGWDCRGLYHIPKGTPYPLFEHLLITRSTPLAYLSSKPSRKITYHARLRLSPSLNMNGIDEFGMALQPIGDEPAPPAPATLHPGLAPSNDTLTHRASSATLRPPMGGHRNSWRNSMVKAPSPLRHQVADSLGSNGSAESVMGSKETRRKTVGLGLAGVFIPPGDSPAAVGQKDQREEQELSSKEKTKSKRASIFGMPTFGRKSSKNLLSTLPAVPAPGPPTPVQSTNDLAPPRPLGELRQSRSNPHLPRLQIAGAIPSVAPMPRPRQHSNRQSGLWSSPTLASTPSSPLGPARAAGARPSSQLPPSHPRSRTESSIPSSTAATAPVKSQPTFADTTAPAFSRSTLRRSGIIMPAAAPARSPRGLSSPSTPSLSPSSSSSSISTISSTSSGSSHSGSGSGSRSFFPTMVRIPSDDFAPPRAGFMRRGSSSSLGSNSSSESVATITPPVKGLSNGAGAGALGYSAEALGSMNGGFVKTAASAPVAQGQQMMQGRKAEKEKKEGMMKGFGKIFGMKKRA